MSTTKHIDFRRPAVERRDGSRARRKEDLALLLAAHNLKMLRDQNAPIESLHQQIDYLHDLVDQVMNKHRPQPEQQACTSCGGHGADPMSDNSNWLPCRDCGGRKRTDAAHDQPTAA